MLWLAIPFCHSPHDAISCLWVLKDLWDELVNFSIRQLSSSVLVSHYCQISLISQAHPTPKDNAGLPSPFLLRCDTNTWLRAEAQLWALVPLPADGKGTWASLSHFQSSPSTGHQITFTVQGCSFPFVGGKTECVQLSVAFLLVQLEEIYA